MRLSDLLKEKNIKIHIEKESKTGVIEELMDLASETGCVVDREVGLQAVLDREKLMSTGLEKGVAVPHAKSKAVEDIVLTLAISPEGIDFESADGRLSHLFFFLLAPEDAAAANVKVLAQIARLTSNPDVCRDLKRADSAEEVMEIIKAAE